MKTRTKTLGRVLAALMASGLFLAHASRAGAETIFYAFNSFGPGSTYNGSLSWAVTGSSTTGGFRGQGEWFVPSIAGNLSTIQVALSYHGGSGLSTFYLAQDNGSGFPGTILETFNNVFAPGGLVVLESSATPLLQTGTKYWLAAEAADSTANIGWFTNNQNYKPGSVFERAPWTWQILSPPGFNASAVFNVAVIPVPEPSSFSLLLLGGGLFLFRARKSAKP